MPTQFPFVRALLLVLATSVGVKTAVAQDVTAFALIDAQTNSPIPGFESLETDAIVNLALLDSSALNIEALTTPSIVGSVAFVLTGPQSENQTENVAPYALFGDSSGNFNPWSPPLGAYTLTATAYSKGNASGTSGQPLSVSFTVVNDPLGVNQPPIVDAGPPVSLPISTTAVDLIGTATDPDGSIASTLWTQIAGPSALITGAQTLAATASGLEEAVYIFRLSATDNDGASSSDDLRVVVGEPGTTAVVTGELLQWHRVSLTFPGPEASEGGANNPFLNYRMAVTFSQGEQSYTVPGFFAADGEAVLTGATSGNLWRVHFAPPSPGEWAYTVSFRSGEGVAIDPDPSAGEPAFFDGDAGTLSIGPTNKLAPDMRALGRLAYVGEHYLQHLGSGDYFIKAATDSPENILGYTGFDNTIDGGAGPNTPDGLHAYPTHIQDWNPGDPDWDRNDPPGTNNGRAIIGALNYLAERGVNSIYFLPMNIGGDGRDTWPYSGPIAPNGSAANDNTRFDVSKLDQWEVVFQHAQALGIHLHFVLAEAEANNKLELDNATVGVERRLFYRELAARFAHHNALQWNVCEEYNLSLNIGSAEALNWARAISQADPYGHPVTVHNAGNPSNTNSGPWAPFIGQADIDLTSLQDAGRTTGWSTIVENFRAASANAGRPIPIMIDEPGSPTRDFNNDFDAFRKSVIWPILLSGGGGEWFINNRDQSLEDFREFEQIWDDSFRCRSFLTAFTPFWRLTPNDDLIIGAGSGFDGPQAFACEGEIYALYLPAGGEASLDLGGSVATFDVRWYNPRETQPLLVGAVMQITGPGIQPIGAPPSVAGEDWAVLVTVVEEPCPGDADGSGGVDLADLNSILARFGGAVDPGSPGDFDGSGMIDLPDLNAVLANFGTLCP